MSRFGISNKSRIWEPSDGLKSFIKSSIIFLKVIYSALCSLGAPTESCKCSSQSVQEFSSRHHYRHLHQSWPQLTNSHRNSQTNK